MITTFIEEEVISLIDPREPLAIAIKGAWGTGKTWFWRNKILPCIRQKKVKYAYTSLYQVEEISELSKEIGYSLIEDLIPGKSQNDSDNFLTRLAKNFLKNDTSVSFSGFNLAIPVATTLDEMAFFRVKEAVICIDDIERRGKGLNLEKLFSFIHYLTESRRCIVVVLLNFDQLEEGERAEWRARSEKIFDRELTYSPKIDDVASISTPEAIDQRWGDPIRKCLQRLEVTNIRVATRARRITDNICRDLVRQQPDIDPGILAAIVDSCVPFSVVHSEQGNGAPKLKELLKGGFGYRVDEARTPAENAWQERLQNYGAVFGDVLDTAIAESVECGFPLFDIIIPAVEKFRRERITQQQRDDFHRAWQLYHESFSRNEEFLADNLYNAISPLVAVETITNIEDTSRILRAAGRSDLATAILKAWAHSAVESNHNHPLKDFFGGRPKDEELIQLIDETKKKYLANPPIDLRNAMRILNDAISYDEKAIYLHRIAQEEPNDIAAILMDTEVDWATLMQNILPELSNQSNEKTAAAVKLNAALQIVAATSPLNQDRVDNKRRRVLSL